MEQIREDKLSPLARKAFLRLLPIQIIEVVVFAINTFIDSVITSRFLGTDGMTGVIGSDAVWLSFPFSEIICILVIAVSEMPPHLCETV